MYFKYVPNTIDYKLVGISYDDFLNLQIFYKSNFERLLNSLYNFNLIDNYINQNCNNLPVIDDADYNFYKKFSTLGSKYIYLRNNIHIERLDAKDLEYLCKNFAQKTNLDANFIINTYKKVLFENGQFTFFGNAYDGNLVKCESIIFEFAFDSKKCKTVEQVTFAHYNLNNILNLFKNIIISKMNVDVSIHLYDGIPDEYKSTDSSIDFNSISSIK